MLGHTCFYTLQATTVIMIPYWQHSGASCVILSRNDNTMSHVKAAKFAEVSFKLEEYLALMFLLVWDKRWGLTRCSLLKAWWRPGMVATSANVTENVSHTFKVRAPVFRVLYPRSQEQTQVHITSRIDAHGMQRWSLRYAFVYTSECGFFCRLLDTS